MKAQRTCLMRAKNIMALNFYSFIWRYIRHKTRRHPSSLTWSTRLHYARRLLICRQSVLHHTWLENSEWVIHPHNTLLNCHTRFTQQTIMQPLYVTLFIMLRGYLDEFQIAGAKNATQQIRNRLGAPTRNVSSSDGTAIYEGQERKMLYII